MCLLCRYLFFLFAPSLFFLRYPFWYFRLEHLVSLVGWFFFVRIWCALCFDSVLLYRCLHRWSDPAIWNLDFMSVCWWMHEIFLALFQIHSHTFFYMRNTFSNIRNGWHISTFMAFKWNKLNSLYLRKYVRKLRIRFYGRTKGSNSSSNSISRTVVSNEKVTSIASINTRAGQNCNCAFSKFFFSFPVF